MAERAVGLWDLVDRQRSASRPVPRHLRWVVGAMPALVSISVLAVAVFLPRDLGMDARLALFGFGTAAILWTLTDINAAYVALGVVLLLALGGAIEQEDLFETLESDVIWLMIGAFILGAAVQGTGLAARLTRLVGRRTRTVGGMMWLMTAMLLPLSFLIPSTSGRAAVALPVFRSLSVAAGNAKVTRALALLIPTVILVSTISSLVGAGSHLIANDLLGEVTDRTIGFGQWLLYGLPFGIAASLISTFVIGRLFLDRATRHQQLKVPQVGPDQPLSRAEWQTLTVMGVMVVLWLTEARHGLKIATVSVIGAFVLTLPGLGVLAWKDGLKAVSWNLIFFVGAALALGEALIETGAASWLIGQMFAASGLSEAGSPMLLLIALSLVTLTSHIYLTSHAARAAAMVPPLLYLANALDVNPIAVMFIGTVGMNYCLTFPVSSKALLMFQEIDRETWVPADLLRLSAVLLPIHAALIIVVYYGYWRYVGLAL